ncbi:MAG: mechanosensitive ion channel family protein [Saprospiraceae bacterium]
MDFDLVKYSTAALEWLLAFLPGALMAIGTLIFGFWFANKVDDIVEGGLKRSSLSPELTSFFGSMSTIVVKGIVLMLAAGFIGFNTASLIGILAAGAFAIGFALQGSLSNFAAGILILTFKPFRVGDWISASDVFGKVEEIQILSTIVVSPGMKTIIIPNADIIGGVVTNYTTKGVTRLELEIPMAYESSFPQVKDVIMNVLENNDLVLKEPKPDVGIATYDSHNIILSVRPYVTPDNYWDATYQINRLIKTALHEAQIPMAYSEGVELGKIGA